MYSTVQYITCMTSASGSIPLHAHAGYLLVTGGRIRQCEQAMHCTQPLDGGTESTRGSVVGVECRVGKRGVQARGKQQPLHRLRRALWGATVSRVRQGQVDGTPHNVQESESMVRYASAAFPQHPSLLSHSPSPPTYSTTTTTTTRKKTVHVPSAV